MEITFKQTNPNDSSNIDLIVNIDGKTINFFFLSEISRNTALSCQLCKASKNLVNFMYSPQQQLNGTTMYYTISSGENDGLTLTFILNEIFFQLYSGSTQPETLTTRSKTCKNKKSPGVNQTQKTQKQQQQQHHHHPYKSPSNTPPSPASFVQTNMPHTRTLSPNAIHVSKTTSSTLTKPKASLYHPKIARTTDLLPTTDLPLVTDVQEQVKQKVQVQQAHLQLQNQILKQLQQQQPGVQVSQQPEVQVSQQPEVQVPQQPEVQVLQQQAYDNWLDLYLYPTDLLSTDLLSTDLLSTDLLSSDDYYTQLFKEN